VSVSVWPAPVRSGPFEFEGEIEVIECSGNGRRNVDQRETANDCTRRVANGSEEGAEDDRWLLIERGEYADDCVSRFRIELPMSRPMSKKSMAVTSDEWRVEACDCDGSGDDDDDDDDCFKRGRL
jgi:hypothetical protein